MTGQNDERAAPTLPPHTARLLALMAEMDACSDLWWDARDGHIHFWVGCSDTFAWGTADAEPVGEADVDAMRQALADLRALSHPSADIYAVDLYVCRKRRMRPMRLWLGTHPAQIDGSYKGQKGLADHCPDALPLFLAAGPERDPRTEG